MIYYIANMHFGHKGILKYDNRPLKTIEEHDLALIQNWVKKVGENDAWLCACHIGGIKESGG